MPEKGKLFSQEPTSCGLRCVIHRHAGEYVAVARCPFNLILTTALSCCTNTWFESLESQAPLIAYAMDSKIREKLMSHCYTFGMPGAQLKWVKVEFFRLLVADKTVDDSLRGIQITLVSLSTSQKQGMQLFCRCPALLAKLPNPPPPKTASPVGRSTSPLHRIAAAEKSSYCFASVTLKESRL